MNDVQFLNWVAQRVGPANAINAAMSARVNTMVELLIDKGVFSKEEHNAKFDKVCEKIKGQLASAPVRSPIQNRPQM